MQSLPPTTPKPPQLRAYASMLQLRSRIRSAAELALGAALPAVAALIFANSSAVELLHAHLSGSLHPWHHLHQLLH